MHVHPCDTCSWALGYEFIVAGFSVQMISRHVMTHLNYTTHILACDFVCNTKPHFVQVSMESIVTGNVHTCVGVLCVCVFVCVFFVLCGVCMCCVVLCVCV